jgi:streptomycin 6-kinase
MFDRYLKRWNLARDGVPIVTYSSDLLPVRQDGRPAMLKIARTVEERRGADLMIWWDGNGAARVLARDGDAVLLERATGNRSLTAMVHDGADDEASRILCGVASRLHAPRNRPRPDLIPLSAWFAELEPAVARHGGIFARAADVARSLLNNQREIAVLHGDLHHGNVFDFANIFRNPDLEIAKSPGRLARQATVIAAAARLDRDRLLRWVLAYAGLSAAWILSDGDDATLDLTVAEIAAAEIARG